jgi:hypothetical protein
MRKPETQALATSKPSGAMVYTVQKGANTIPDLTRASAVEPTQREAIARAKELNPKATPMVERVCNTTGGHPDKWRTP